MKRVLSIACLVFTFAFAVSMAAQAPAKIGSDADYATHMKEIGSLNGAMTKAIKAGDGAEAGKAAARLEVLFKNIHEYWNEKKVADATTASTNALTALADIQKALTANDMTAAETARGTLAQQCMACHKEHREKLPEGGWRIK